MDWIEANGASLRYELSGSGAETVVLIHEVGGLIESWDDAVGAFQRSFKLTEGRFERWLEMVAVSVMLVFCGIFLGAVLSLVFPAPGLNAWVAVTQLLIAAMLPIIQYAWTFFYLRLVEVEGIAPGIEIAPAYATTSGTGAPWTGRVTAVPEGEHAAFLPPAQPDPGSDPPSHQGTATASN